MNGTDVEKSKSAVKINENKNKKSSEPDGVVTGSGDVDGKESNQTTKAPKKIKYVWKALDWQKVRQVVKHLFVHVFLEIFHQDL